MKRNIILILGTLIIISTMWIMASGREVETAIDVVAIRPKMKNIYDYVNADGRIKEGTKKDIYNKLPTRIKRIYVSEGDKVRKGTPLFETESVGEILFAESFFSDEGKLYALLESYGFELPEKESFFFLSDNSGIIKSPIDGIITGLNIKEGEEVQLVKKLISVSDFSDLYIDTLIPEVYSSKVRSGADVKITSEAFGDSSFRGKIESIAPVAKYVPSLTGEGKTYISAKIRTNTPNSAFRPQLTVNAKITVNTVENALTIPYECIMQDERGREYVFCIKDGIIEKQEIVTGYELEDVIEVKSGITRKSLIVYDPEDTLIENMSVNIVESRESK